MLLLYQFLTNERHNPWHLFVQQSKLLDPINRDKSRAAENTDETQYYKPEFKARPPKSLQHVVSTVVLLL